MATIPDETDLLCESCGYTLRGLPVDGRCPECGKAVFDSTGHDRRLPLWEQSDKPGLFPRFLGTTIFLILHPRRFYRTFMTRAPLNRAAAFARIHWSLNACLLALSAFYYLDWYRKNLVFRPPPSPFWLLPFFAGSYLFLSVTTHLAVRLTVLEASFRGYRLPRHTVLRGMYYHAAHVLPVAAVAAATVLGYRWTLACGLLNGTSVRLFLFTLCAEVVLGAAYLFETYWIAMRNMMYANR